MKREKPALVCLAPYQLGDIDYVKARADFEADFLAEGARVPTGPKWTLVGRAGEVLGVTGFRQLAPLEWGAWAYLSDLGRREWLWAANVARAVCAGALRMLPEGSSIVATPADTAAARRTLAYAGFAETADPEIWLFDRSDA